MRKPVVLYIDQTAPHVIPLLAQRGLELGYGAVFVHAPGKAIAFPEAFERLIPTDDWSLDGLRDLRDEVAASYDIRGIYSVHGFFTKQGSIGGHVSILAEELGLPSQGEAAVHRANNKFLMRDALARPGSRRSTSDLLPTKRRSSSTRGGSAFPSC